MLNTSDMAQHSTEILKFMTVLYYTSDPSFKNIIYNLTPVFIKQHF
jgi:hypothetical protein